MTVTSDPSPFNETDFRAIEAAVLETEKGRWFLNEFGRRNRVADTQTLLGALGRLERNLTAQPPSLAQEQPDLAALSSAITATCEDISSVRNDMLNGNAQIPDGKPVFAHMSETAHQIAVDLIATAEALQGTVNVLRKDSTDQTHADTIDSHVHSLYDESWRQDILAQRVSKAMGLLEHLDQNLKVLAVSHSTQAAEASVTEETKAIPLALTEENLKFFDGDDDMFVKDGAEQQDTQTPESEVLSISNGKSKSDEPKAEQVENDSLPQNIADEVKASDNLETFEFASSDLENDATATAQETHDESSSEPVAPAAPLQEPNVVVIQRGKCSKDEISNDHDADNDKEATSVDSNTEETAVERSTSEEKSTDEVFLEATEDHLPLEDQSSVSMAEGEEPVEVQEIEGKPDTTNLLADAQMKEQEASSTDNEAPETEDAMSASTDIKVEAPEAVAKEREGEKPADDPISDEEERIVIIRHTSSEDSEIPFADYLAKDTDQQSKSDTVT